MFSTCSYLLPADLQSWLSSVSRKLKSIFGWSGHEKAAETIDLDVVASNVDKDCMQVNVADNVHEIMKKIDIAFYNRLL